MLDRYVHGDIARISPEAPVPVITLNHTRELLGGAGNAAHNIAALGGLAILISLVADDGPGEAIRRILRGIDNIEAFFVSTSLRPTICKTRFIAGGQQVVRAHDESQLPLEPTEEESLFTSIQSRLGQAQALILSDYAKAVLSRTLIAQAIAAAPSSSTMVIV